MSALETKSATDDPQDEGGVEKALADLTSEFKARSDALALEVKGAKDEAKAAKDRADALELRLNRPGGGAGGETPIEAKAFGVYLRKGRDFLADDESKSLRIADDVAGGYLRAPDDFVGEVLKQLVEFSPVRQVARVTQIGVSGARMPKRTGTPTARWVDETEDRSETEMAYGQVLIPTHEAACFIDVSQQLLEDAAFNVDAEVAQDLAEEFARLEADAFVLGNGLKKPMGFMADAEVPFVRTGHASNFPTSHPGDVLVDVFYGLKSAYARNGTWGMNRRTMAVVRKMKDGQGQYLWQEGLAAGQPPTLLGRPVVEMPEMDDIGAGKEPIVFGDFNAGYRVIDRVALALLRDPYTQATKGLVRMHARRRTGGAVVKPEALVKLRVEANPGG
ncbi:MAG: phage major capsid protein [Salinarimonadaceae bacterium]|nr:MAG: phage major capsid protein [Salinarimonadaceae bacterium]